MYIAILKKIFVIRAQPSKPFKIVKIWHKILFICTKITIFATKTNLSSNMKDLNRLKVVLAEKKKTNKWLAEQLGKNVTTVSKWCTNTSQPDLLTLDRIAELLNCDKRDLITQ